MSTVDPPNTAELDAIYSEYDQFIRSTSTKGSLHLAPDVDESRPACYVHGPGGAPAEWRTIPTAAMPKRYREICGRCVKFWRDSR